MNHIQFGLFVVFWISVLISGSYFYSHLTEKDPLKGNRCIALGESLLIGSIILYGSLMLLGIMGLYSKPFIWAAVSANFLFLFKERTRSRLKLFFSRSFPISLPFFVFIVMLLLFIYRNCYFLVDVDSHSTYLLTQKIWLTYGKSTIGSPGIDARFYIPQFDTVFYSLGLSVYPKETLFPQLINTYWRVIALILAFGYTSYRFNKYYGLAASMFLFFNYHFHFSGANKWVIINPAIISFIFVSSYCFLESRRNNSNSRFFLALIFLSFIPSNKYQGIFVMFFIFVFGLFIQRSLIEKIQSLFEKKKKTILFILFISISLLIFLKNYIATGSAIFPILAGKFHLLNRHPEMDEAFRQYAHGVDFRTFVKYIGYLHHFSEVMPAKRVFFTLVLLPLILLKILTKNELNKEKTIELVYWIALSVFALFGICYVTHQDPRYYCYPIALMAFASIYSLDYILTECFRIKNIVILCMCMLYFASRGYKLYKEEGGFYNLPYYKENLLVLKDKLHTADIIDTYFLHQTYVEKGLEENQSLIKRSAWDYSQFGTNYSPFLVPIRPQVSFWWTTIIKWESYESEEKVIKDLKDFGIEYVMGVENAELKFIPIAEFAKEAVNFDKYPKRIQFPGYLPEELTRTKYTY